jgi:hypothetical protein
MRRLLAATVAGGMFAAAFALSASRTGARADRELASELFTHPISLTPSADRLLPLVDDGEAREIGDADRVLRIGGEPEAVFGRVADVAPSLSGDTVFVLDGMSATVSAFGRDGSFLFRFGGKGDGPGEFREPTQLLVLPWSGELAVWDAQAQRLAVHTPAGRLVRVANPDAARRTTSRTVQRIDAFGGGYVVQVNADPLLVRPGSQRGALVRMNPALRATDTLFHFPVASVRASHVEWEGGSSATTWLRPPVFSPEPRWDLQPDGTVLFAPGGPAEAYRLDADGGVLRVRWPVEPRRLTRGDRLRRLAGERDRGLIGTAATPLAVLEPFNRGSFAESAPAVTGVLAGPAGTLWVRGFDTRDGWEGFARSWARADAAGRALPPVRLPPRFTPRRVVAGRIYGIREDEMNAQSVEVYGAEGGR